MSSDDSTKTGSQGPKMRGIGHFSAFMCGACAKPKGVPGRKLARVHGINTWVCAACAETRKPK